MCKDSAAYKAFMQITPRRNFNEIKEELKLCHDHYLEMNEKEGNKCMEYDYAFIGENDRIIPPDNQKNNHSYLHPDKMLVTDCAHYDETMFHLLLQDAWDMPSDNFMLHLKTIHIDN